MVCSDKLLCLVKKHLTTPNNLVGNYVFSGKDGTGNKTEITIPAVTFHWRKSDIPKKFKLGDNQEGLEVIIEDSPDMKMEHKLGGRQIINTYFDITIDQHNKNKPGDLTKAVEIIYSVPFLRPRKQPIIRPRGYVAEDNAKNQLRGEINARAIVCVEFNKLS